MQIIFIIFKFNIKTILFMKKITLLLAICLTSVSFAQSFPSPYCNIAFVYDVEEITQVTLNNTTITNSDVTSILVDATSNPINLTPGQTYTIDVKGNTYGEENQFYLYIDWNRNGILNDTGENTDLGIIFNSDGYDSQSVKYTFTVPNGITAGNIRARVIKSWIYFPYAIGIDNPCTIDIDFLGSIDASYGQALDFTINIVAPSSTEALDLTKLRLYPNPAEDVLNIEYKSEIREISIFDMTGKQLYSRNINDSFSTIDVSTLSPGTYLVKIDTYDNESSTLKFIKK